MSRRDANSRNSRPHRLDSGEGRLEFCNFAGGQRLAVGVLAGLDALLERRGAIGKFREPLRIVAIDLLLRFRAERRC